MNGMHAIAEPLAKSGEAVKSGPIGLAVILILCIACYFLFKSMSKHLRTVRETFPTEAPTGDAAAEPQAATNSASETEVAAEAERPAQSPSSTPPAGE